jgi:hypothetical protein
MLKKIKTAASSPAIVAGIGPVAAAWTITMASVVVYAG